MSLINRIHAVASSIAIYLRDSIIPKLVPAGGFTGQVLTKASALDHSLTWANPGGIATLDITRVEIDFGSSSQVIIQNFTISGVTAGQKIVAALSLDMPVGIAEDELEMDPICLGAHAPSADTVRVIAMAQHPVSGKRAVNILK